MIKEHEFNTRWWGSPVGILDDPAFFEQPAEEQQRLLKPYGWAEYRSLSADCASPATIGRAGFFWADVQLRFRLAMQRVTVPPSAEGLELVFADEEPFSLTEEVFADFAHERFHHLPGGSTPKINQRYVQWANLLVTEHPEWCVQVRSQGVVQGWFLSRPEGQKLNLALATLHSGANVSGLLLYAAAIKAYANRGARLGAASFSVTNSAVHNLYSQLGARFGAPELCWLWVSE